MFVEVDGGLGTGVNPANVGTGYNAVIEHNISAIPKNILFIIRCIIVEPFLLFVVPATSNGIFIITNKKRHEVMYSYPSNLGIAKHLCGDGV